MHLEIWNKMSEVLSNHNSKPFCHFSVPICKYFCIPRCVPSFGKSYRSSARLSKPRVLCPKSNPSSLRCNCAVAFLRPKVWSQEGGLIRTGACLEGGERTIGETSKKLVPTCSSGRLRNHTDVNVPLTGLSRFLTRPLDSTPL